MSFADKQFIREVLLAFKRHAYREHWNIILKSDDPRHPGQIEQALQAVEREMEESE